MKKFMIIGKRSHPSSQDHVVVHFKTKVDHQIALETSLSDSEIKETITKYLEEYEKHYPETSIEERYQ